MARTAYQRHKINRVIDFVRASDAPQLSLDEMADIACLSRYHFSRVFQAACGETPIAFLTRHNLEKAMTSLVHKPGLSITDIALEAGFSGSQAFSHAFKRRYGAGPKRIRDANLGRLRRFPKNQIGHYPARVVPSEEGGDTNAGWSVSLREQPELRLAYIRHIGPYFALEGMSGAARGLDLAFDRLVDWAMARGLWENGTRIYGLCPHNIRVTPPRYCQYDVCIPVDEMVHADEVVSIQHMKSMTYAAIETWGDTATLMQAWQWVIEDWAPSQGVIATSQTPFEIFHAEQGTLLYPENGITICLPVTKAKSAGLGALQGRTLRDAGHVSGA